MRIGAKMREAVTHVAASPGCTKYDVARKVSPDNIIKGYAIVDRAIDAGLIRVEDTIPSYSLYPVKMCAWFAGCGRPATGTTPHPILGDVDTCDRCHKFATGTERQAS